MHLYENEINDILNRTVEENKIKKILSNFTNNKTDAHIKKNIFIYGDTGIGKTTFINKILKELNYDIIKYDTGDIRNKINIDNIAQDNMSDKNIMSMFNKKIQKIAIIMDEIDGMNNGDKNGINALIKLVRPKKTKKQKKEELSLNPIICISNFYIDKKIKELMNVCNIIELKIPTINQITQIIDLIMPLLDLNIKSKVIEFIQFDLRKIKNIYDIYLNNRSLLNEYFFANIFQQKYSNDDSKNITKKILNNTYLFKEHSIMNETDRTIVGLLWHENIVDALVNLDKKISIPFYVKILNNICFGDYIDRITFQKQIWQFNEMSSLIKVFKNNLLYKEFVLENIKEPFVNIKDIRFTKVLTKYSTEYNNYIFIQTLCQTMSMDKKDLYSFFIFLKLKYNDDQIVDLLENFDITKLDINRIYRYLNKFTKDNVDDDLIDDDYEYELII